MNVALPRREEDFKEEIFTFVIVEAIERGL
jgi:hypothetical protein